MEALADDQIFMELAYRLNGSTFRGYEHFKNYTVSELAAMIGIVRQIGERREASAKNGKRSSLKRS